MGVKRKRMNDSGGVSFPILCFYIFNETKIISEKFFLSDPELKSNVPLEYLSHKEKYEESVRKACLLFKKVQQLQSEGRGGIDNFK